MKTKGKLKTSFPYLLSSTAPLNSTGEQGLCIMFCLWCSSSAPAPSGVLSIALHPSSARSMWVSHKLQLFKHCSNTAPYPTGPSCPTTSSYPQVTAPAQGLLLLPKPCYVNLTHVVKVWHVFSKIICPENRKYWCVLWVSVCRRLSICKLIFLTK